jgi:predicted negative regulator of RcsB-dependent stress response
MAKHPTSSRVRREEQAPDDAFVSFIQRSIIWAKENSRVLITAGVVVVALAAGLTWFLTQQQRTERMAASEFARVQQSVVSGNTQLAIRDLETYLATYGSTETADQARIILADLLIGQDRADEAVDVLGSLPDDVQAPFGLAAARIEAAALEALGQVDQAVDAYLRVADNARFDYQQREALADAARVRLQNGDAENAADLYQRIVDSLEDDAAATGRGYYEMWLAEAQAQARTGSGAAPTPPDSTATAAESENG